MGKLRAPGAAHQDDMDLTFPFATLCATGTGNAEARHRILGSFAMNIDAVTSAISAVSAASTAVTSAANTAAGTTFAATLSSSLAQGKADFVSGRLGIDLDRRGQPAKVIYFDEQGNRLRASTFNASAILKNAAEFGIPLTDLRGLGEQLDTAGIGYRPYELYRGTGSDHGINFDDLIAGGLGTAYDWRRDAQVAQKGETAAPQLAAAQALADQLQLTKHADVTTERGIDPSAFLPLSSPGESPRQFVVFNGGVAAWYRTAEAAATAARQYGGSVMTLPSTSSTGSSAAGTAEASVAAAVANTATANVSTPSSSLAAAAAESAATSPPVDRCLAAEAEHSAGEGFNRLAQQLDSLLAANSNSERLSALDSLVASLNAFRGQQQTA